MVGNEGMVFWTDAKDYVKSSRGKEMSPMLHESMLNFCWVAGYKMDSEGQITEREFLFALEQK